MALATTATEAKEYVWPNELESWTVADVIMGVREVKKLRCLEDLVKYHAMDGYFLSMLSDDAIDKLMEGQSKVVNRFFRRWLRKLKQQHSEEKLLLVIVKQTEQRLYLSSTEDDFNLRTKTSDFKELLTAKYDWQSFSLEVNGERMDDELNLLKQGVFWVSADPESKESEMTTTTRESGLSLTEVGRAAFTTGATVAIETKSISKGIVAGVSTAVAMVNGEMNEKERFPARAIVVDRSPKCLTAEFAERHNFGLSFDQPDMITHEIEEGFPCAIMSCGHCISPDSLTRYLRECAGRQQENITCPFEVGVGRGTAFLCKRPWRWSELVFAAMLSNDERLELSASFVRLGQNLKQCVGCESFLHIAEDLNSKKVWCVGCNSYKCFRCMNTWNAMGNDHCGNVDCDRITALNRDLANCETIAYCLGDVTFPKLRLCPNETCKALISHAEACKHMVCPECGINFCMSCLRKKESGMWPKDCGSYRTNCDTHPPQTME